MRENSIVAKRKAFEWRPGLSETTSQFYDGLFWGHRDAVKESAQLNNELATIQAALTLRSTANVIWGLICLGGAPLATGLWREWAEALLVLQMELCEMGTPAARQAHDLLLPICTVAFSTAREV